MPVPERPWEARTGGGPHIHTCKGTELCSTPPTPMCQSVLLPVGSNGHALLIPAGPHGGVRGTWHVPLAPGSWGWWGVGRAPLTPAASSGDSSVTSPLLQSLSDVSMATFTRISWNIRCLSWKGPRRSAPPTPSAQREESGLREYAPHTWGAVSGCHMPNGAPAFGHHSQPGSLSLRFQTAEFCRTVFLGGVPRAQVLGALPLLSG